MPSRTITVAAIQASFGAGMQANIAKVEALAREAAARGAQVILPPELFQGIYFPTRQDPKWFATAYPVGEHPAVLALASLAKELRAVIPISFFERDGPRFYNSVAIADAGGEILGLYRKSHIPDGPGYLEKYYFRPGDTGFKAWLTRAGTLGVGICWDQWYPEAARAMVLEGAEILFYPTAIGSEPDDPTLDSRICVAARDDRPRRRECRRRSSPRTGSAWRTMTA
jgi:N-carbamoylputrescine amidase